MQGIRTDFTGDRALAAGTAQDLEFAITDQAGADINAAAHTWLFVVAKARGSSHRVKKASSGAGITTADRSAPADGNDETVVVSLAPRDTQPAGLHYFELRSTTSDVVAAYGSLEILPSPSL